jgi:mono/diheme cytochrome c family protein
VVNASRTFSHSGQNPFVRLVPSGFCSPAKVWQPRISWGFTRLSKRRLAGNLTALNFVLLVSFPLVMCGNAQAAQIAANTSTVAITDEARSKAGDIFTERCATCHGANGRGNGPAAANLKPKPIDFHNQNWQKSVTNDTMTKAIIFGGRSVGKSGQMAPNPDLENEPAIVAALVEKIRKWGK